MRISVNQVVEFIDNLKQDIEYIDDVWGRVDEIPSPHDNGIDFEIGLWLTCIVKRPDTPYILELGKIVGPYITEGDDQTDEGHEIAEAHMTSVRKVCSEYGKPFRAGKVEF